MSQRISAGEDVLGTRPSFDGPLLSDLGQIFIAADYDRPALTG